MLPSVNIAGEKQRLRRYAATLPKMEIPHLLEQFFTLPQVMDAPVVMAFYGVGLEPDTRWLLQRLMEAGKRVVLPVCCSGGRMEARVLTSWDNLSAGRYGIPEPDISCPRVFPEEIQVMLVPHMLCDRAGYRLGHGGGYYDRWLARYGGLTVAVCARERLVERLPREGFDLPVQMLLHD